VAELDLSPAGTAVLLLADGTSQRVPEYSAWVHWRSRRRLILVDATVSGSALIGARLLFPHHLSVDYAARTVEIA
jgi:hypothetical protein